MIELGIRQMKDEAVDALRLRELVTTILTAWAFAMGAPMESDAAVSVWIDLDPDIPGIQNTIGASPGSLLTANLVVEADAAGLSSYAISVRFDTTKLSLNGSPSASEFLFLDFDANITPGVEAESEDVGGGLGEVLTFEAVSFGLGPANSTFVAGAINFIVSDPSGGGSPDIDADFFNVSIDGAFDSAGLPAPVVFSGANLNPVVCGDGVTEGVEQCDDSNVADLDGCSRTCRLEESHLFAGTAQGGSVEFVIEGVAISITTVSGQTAAQVADQMADAINADSDLAALGVVAEGNGDELVVAGAIQSTDINDPGLVASVPIAPWLSLALIGLLILTGMGWIHGERRQREVSSG